MELTYQSPLMPASYTALSADEMTYIDGGAIQIGSYLIEFHPRPCFSLWSTSRSTLAS